MSDSPDNLVLKMLREIRVKQDELSAGQGRHTELLEQLDRDFQELRHSVVYSLGLGTTEHLKNKEQDGKLDDQKRRIDRLFDQLEDLMSKR